MFPWAPLLSLFKLEGVAGAHIKLQQKMMHVIHDKIKTYALSASYQSATSDNKCFEKAFLEKSGSSEKVLNDFLEVTIVTRHFLSNGNGNAVIFAEK